MGRTTGVGEMFHGWGIFLWGAGYFELKASRLGVWVRAWASRSDAPQSGEGFRDGIARELEVVETKQEG